MNNRLMRRLFLPRHGSSAFPRLARNPTKTVLLSTRSLSSFYDSQSGQHVELPAPALTLHDISGWKHEHEHKDKYPPTNNNSLNPRDLSFNADSIEVEVTNDSNSLRASFVRGGGVLALVRTESDVALAARSGGFAGATVPHELGRNGSVEIARVAASTKGLLTVRAEVAVSRPATSGGALDAQLWTAQLADEGVSVITLVPLLGEGEGQDPLGGMDGDDLAELIDVCCGVDVPGVPIRKRLALRLPPPGHGEEGAVADLALAAAEGGIFRFDSDFSGERAPTPYTMMDALESFEYR